jgi:lipopolysaccharide/colanic/teichoic acid biosynthesis glycosyltransferase
MNWHAFPVMRTQKYLSRPSPPLQAEQMGKTRTAPQLGGVVLDEPAFAREIYLERRRAERNHRSLVLMLLDASAIPDPGARTAGLRETIRRLPDLLRDTDKLGWYQRETTLGVLLPDLRCVTDGLIRKFAANAATLLQDSLGAVLAGAVEVTIHVFPDPMNWRGEPPDLALYPELHKREQSPLVRGKLKRIIDVLVSALALLLLSPLLAGLAIAIRYSSPGPALFRQERLGRYGKRFTCLKFRSMRANSDPGRHEDYVRKFIAGALAGAGGIYKLTDDPRVTEVGRFLRKTSLDEVPQLWNVLRGEMSLVGPRPPLAYEFEHYAAWHRRRIFEAKPGLTGLWQVQGRSRTSFDDMVRLDLRYARNWSLWLDLKILWDTPRAVLSGQGAC